MRCAAITLILLLGGWLHAEPLTLTSGSQPPAVIELYTSEGCRSCPPADLWLSRFTERRNLFEDVIPMAFHVGYWDWIGWADRFAQPAFGRRQSDYVRAGRLSQRYTPGILVNNEEFRQWFRGRRHVAAPRIEREPLTVTLSEDNRLTAEYPTQHPLILNIAYLGMGLTTEVKRGENAGKRLKHDFVVLDLFQSRGQGTWRLNLPEASQVGQEKTAIAAWVARPDDPAILQAVAGYLSGDRD